MNVRLKKILRDLTSDIPKNAMLVVAIAIGVFGVGTILGGYAVLKREMATNYGSTVPADATIKVDGASLDPALVESIARREDIVHAERHSTVSGRMKIGEAWYPLLLFVVDDFQRMQTNKVAFVSGASVPPDGTMLVERTSYDVMLCAEGEEIVVKTPSGRPTLLRISGTVHDPGLAPARQEKTGYGYITLATLRMLGETQGFDELRISVPESQRTVESIRRTAIGVNATLEQQGYGIHEVQIPPPGRHPHQGQMNAVLLLFTIFSFLLLALSSILVSASIATLMVRQIREIGIMKTIGANTKQIALLYFAMILVLCLLAVLPAVPLSQHAALFFAGKISGLLNLRIFDSSIPGWVLGVQIIAGMLIPLIAAAIPVVRGSRISVREALANYGMSRNSGASAPFLVKLLSPTMFGETFALSVRNVFRQRSRLFLSLGLLSAGGAMFITALNVSKAWDTNLQKIYQQRFYDLDIRLNRSRPSGEITTRLKNIAGIRSIGEWAYSSTSFITDVKFNIVQTYPDKGHGSFLIIGVPQSTRMIQLPVMEGRWLTSERGNDVVLNQMALAQSPSLEVGDSIALSIENTVQRWRIVGIVEDLYSPATAYVSYGAFLRASDLSGSNMVRLSFVDRDPASVARGTRAIEDLFLRTDVSIYQCVPVSFFRNAIGEHMGVLVSSLIAMAVLMALVGSLGLASTISMNIMERTREIGVMRAVGATPAIIRRLVIWEGFVTGMLSIVGAIALSLLLSYGLGIWLGAMAFRSPLSLTLSMSAILLWIGIVVLGSTGAAFFPAQRATRITTWEALAYE
jgi:putative ABC transport system permease protein